VSKPILILNGPNLNLLGTREPHIYGTTTLSQVDEKCCSRAEKRGLTISFHQSNSEAQIIDWIHGGINGADGIIINPAAFTHTSVAILDALNMVKHPIIELHISNPHKREAFRHRVASFVNCYGRSECGWTMPDLQALLPTHQFDVHGIDGEVLKPIGVLAAKMAASGWAFHDKVQGDGFGHVVHGWAAVGRPLVGHASHYAGKMAEPLWQDLVTCVDLDRHDVREAAAIIADVSDEPARHAAMCRAIRAEFDRLYDPAADAEAIRGLLAPVLVPA
jgi:3-dehydroquinate dehydratase-2